MHGLSIKSHTQGEWDWELAASRYDYDRDDKRQNAAANRAARRRRAAAPARSPTAAAPAGPRWRPRASGGRQGARARTSSTSACSTTLPAALPDLERSPATTSATRAGALASDVRRRRPAAAACGRRTSGASRRAGRRCSAARSNTGRRQDGQTAFSASSVASTYPARSETPLLAQGGAVLAVAAATRCSRPRSAARCACRRWPSSTARPRPPTRSSSTTRTCGPRSSWTTELSGREGPRQRRCCALTGFAERHARRAVFADHARRRGQPQRQPACRTWTASAPRGMEVALQRQRRLLTRAWT